MGRLFLKSEHIMASPPVLGYAILHYMKKKNIEKISIFDVADFFKKEKWFSTKKLYFAMLFLFSVGLIYLDKIYIVKNVNN